MQDLEILGTVRGEQRNPVALADALRGQVSGQRLGVARKGRVVAENLVADLHSGGKRGEPAQIGEANARCSSGTVRCENRSEVRHRSAARAERWPPNCASAFPDSTSTCQGWMFLPEGARAAA